MAVFRKIEEIRALDLTAAEEELLRACSEGEVADIGDTVPDAGETDKCIRAGIIRYLMLGGCADYRPHEKGVRVRGALIPDELDLEGCACDRDLLLASCRLMATLTLRGARMATVNLCGSQCRDIRGDGLKTTGDVNLRTGFRAEGEVRLLGAQIGGDLGCDGGAFLNAEGDALCADALSTTGSVFLSYGFRAAGEVRLPGARIGGDLDCGNGAFESTAERALNADSLSTTGGVFLRNGFRAEGEVWLRGARVGGDLDCGNGVFENAGGRALSADAAVISGGFFWRAGARAEGVIDLIRARCGHLNDDRACWPRAAGSLRLDGFTYDAISGGPVSAETRLEWLALCDGRSVGKDFWPQPYEQLAKVLREIGHANDARTVLVEKERLQRADYRRRLIAGARASGWTRPIAYVWAGLSWFWQQLLDGAVGFGYRPQYALYILFAMILAGGWLFQNTWDAGDFAPNSAVVLNSEHWRMIENLDNPAEIWSARTGYGRDYESFQSLAYAFDVVVPLIDLGQEAAWAPSTTRSAWGWHAWWLRWVLKILGWIVSALGAAAITGIIRRE